MLLAVWIGLAVSLGAVIYGGALAITHGLRTWRASRRFSRGLTERLDTLAAASAQTEQKAASVSQGSIRLTEALERLRRSQAELAVLREAAAEVSSSSAVLRSFFPRK